MVMVRSMYMQEMDGWTERVNEVEWCMMKGIRMWRSMYVLVREVGGVTNGDGADAVSTGWIGVALNVAITNRLCLKRGQQFFKSRSRVSVDRKDGV